MNAIDLVTERPFVPAAASHSTHKFRLLLRREFWEHKGGFLWAPAITGGVFLLLSMIPFVAAEVVRYGGLHNVQISAFGLHLTGSLTAPDADTLRGLGLAIDGGMYAAAVFPLIALSFVVFFYCLGALYDERKDRSILFWKSLPLSDRSTVLSKVATALILAPAIAVAIAIVTMFDFLGLFSVAILLRGGNPIRLLWEPASPLAVTGSLVASLPIYAVWALPTVGWLMLCSAWAKSKPFLWATAIPVLAGVWVFWFDMIYDNDWASSSWFWDHIVSRLLLNVVPGTWLPQTDRVRQASGVTPDTLMDVANAYGVLATPEVWIGAVAGLVMIYGAIRLRRWRDEG